MGVEVKSERELKKKKKKRRKSEGIRFRKKENGRAPVAHACHPSYSGGREQEDHGSKPALGK
jgi:hypothetical protein